MKKQNTVRIILISIIFLILCAIGAYSILYWSKISEKIQAYSKKTETVPKFEKNTVTGELSKLEEPAPSKETPRAPIDPMPEKEKPNTFSNPPLSEREPPLNPVKTEEKKHEPIKSKILEPKEEEPAIDEPTFPNEKKSDLLLYGENEKPAKPATLLEKKTAKKHARHKKYKKLKFRGSSKNLAARVSRIEKKLGIKAGKKESLSSRIYRLEKTIYKK